jgi:chemotaxis protein MotB
MRNKLKIEEHDNTERWMVSYADFITLLFAFFTVMYAISHVDAGKLEKFAGSTKDAFNANSAGEKIQVIEEIAPVYDDFTAVEAELKKAVDALVANGYASVKRDERGVVISLGDNILFDAGEAIIRESAVSALAPIASVIQNIPHHISIEGHTDNLPIRSSLFPSNWELSTLRAANVLSYLIKNYNLPPERFSIAGYAEFKPVASNETPHGRAKNRRVDIVVLNHNSKGENR